MTAITDPDDIHEVIRKAENRAEQEWQLDNGQTPDDSLPDSDILLKVLVRRGVLNKTESVGRQIALGGPHGVFYMRDIYEHHYRA